MKFKLYLGNCELSHLFRATCSLKEDLQIKLEREVDLEGLCLLKWRGVNSCQATGKPAKVLEEGDSTRVWGCLLSLHV